MAKAAIPVLDSTPNPELEKVLSGYAVNQDLAPFSDPRRYIRDGSLFRENSAGKLGL